MQAGLDNSQLKGFTVDPNATLLELLESLQDGKRDKAVECCRSLADWMERGGFCPMTIPAHDAILASGYESWIFKSRV